MNAIASIYVEKKIRVRINTSLKPFIQALNKNKQWQCKRFGRVGKSGGLIKASNNRITATFQYREGSNV